jgi:Ni/Co efflux regulator RcnB
LLRDDWCIPARFSLALRISEVEDFDEEESKMRKLIMSALMAATVIPAAADAQSWGEVRHDQREVNQDRRDLARSQVQGDGHDARDARHGLRNDRRETHKDWRDYRTAHRDVFRGGVYTGPRGYAYRPVGVGYRFSPDYYQRRYWIDPVHYRLPSAAVWQRWVRYGNDVVLVDTRSGRVITVYNSFFW